MKEKLTLTALIITVLTGCKVNQQACEAYSQCDELYMSDYNCDLQPRILTTPQYPYGSTPVYGTRAYPAYNYGYPYGTYNTVYIDNCCDVPASSPVITNQPRPSIYNTRPNVNKTPGRKPNPQLNPSSRERN